MLRERIEEARRRLGLGKRGLGLKALLKFREHLSRLRREGPFAVLYVAVAVESGLPPLKAFEALKDADSLPATRLEARRVLRDAQLGLRTLGEQLALEARSASGVWGRLLSTIVSVEASGLDPKAAFRDLLRLVLRDLRTDYERLARRFQSLISAASVAFGAFPMMIAVLLAVLASFNTVPMLLAFTAANALIAALWLLTVDLQVPDLLDYRPFYRRIALKWLPIGVAVGLAVYTGLLFLPISLVSTKALALALGALAFSLPASLEWKLQRRVGDELLESLPLVLRTVAEQVDRGLSPHQALENAAALGGFPKYTTRLLSLIVKEARVYGSLRDAYERVKALLPRPWRVSLELLTLADEAGAGSAAIHALADSMAEYVLAVRELRRSTSIYRWVALGMVGLTLGLLALVANTVMVKMALAGALLEENALISAPIRPPPPEELPAIKDWIYAAAAANSLALAVVTGKTVGWRLGDALPEVAKASLLILAFLAAGYWIL